MSIEELKKRIESAIFEAKKEKVETRDLVGMLRDFMDLFIDNPGQAVEISVKHQEYSLIIASGYLALRYQKGDIGELLREEEKENKEKMNTALWQIAREDAIVKTILSIVVSGRIKINIKIIDIEG